MFKSFVALVVAVGLVQVATGAEKKRDWQIGRLLDSGMVSAPNILFPKTDDYCFQLTIQNETIVYVASTSQLTWGRLSRDWNLTINGPIKFAIEKRKFFVIDGKEHQLGIISKTLRHPQETRQKES